MQHLSPQTEDGAMKTTPNIPTVPSHRLQLTDRERRTLEWLGDWSRKHLTRLKRLRKYRPREKTFDAQEAETLYALIELERTAGLLLNGRGKR